MEFDFTKEPGKRLLNRGLNAEGEPLVSIITPYYNAGKYFKQTFNCVMNQTFPWFEWIIVDDGSTQEDSISLLDEIESRDNRITVIHKENGGIATARNRAVSESHTDIIIPLDADDLIIPTYVEKLYWALYYNPEYSWAYTNSTGFQNQEYLWEKPFDADLLRTENFLIYSSAIRKADILDVNGYDEITKHYNEDWRMWLKFLTAHKKPVRVKDYGFWYRRLDTGVLSIVNKDPEIRKVAKKLIAEVAATADPTVKAKEYPVRANIQTYVSPKCSAWDRKVFKKHNKLHVMMLLPWLEMGGADLFNLDICRLIDKNRFEVSILTTQPGEHSWQQQFEDHVTDIFHLPNFLDVENYPEFISYFIKSREIDVLFLSNSYYGYYLLPWLRKEFPDLAIVDYVHSETWYWRNGGYARTSGAMGEILEKTYLCNEQTRQTLIHNFGRTPEDTETLYIGVDQEKYNAPMVEAGLSRKELSIAEGRPIILFPCRVHPEKRPFLMVEIAKELRKTMPDVAFVVVGDGPQLEELRIKVQQEGLEETVYLAGRQNDMRPFYKDSALTLICSLREGLSLTAYESLSMGKPVITSDVGGQKELIDETVGRVLPMLQNERDELDNRDFLQKEIMQYVTALKELLSDSQSYNAACAACRARIETGFSTRIMIQKLEAILDDLVKNDEKAAQRAERGRMLRRFDHMVDDFVLTYQLLHAAQAECEEVWKGREWFRQLYEQEKLKRAALPAAAECFVPVVTCTDAKETVLAMYQKGEIGGKYIIQYIKAWVRFKFFGRGSKS